MPLLQSPCTMPFVRTSELLGFGRIIAASGLITQDTELRFREQFQLPHPHIIRQRPPGPLLFDHSGLDRSMNGNEFLTGVVVRIVESVLGGDSGFVRHLPFRLVRESHH